MSNNIKDNKINDDVSKKKDSDIKGDSQKTQGYNMAARIIAMAGVVLILFFVIGMVVCAVTGSKYFNGFLFGCIVIPILLYVFKWLAGVLKGRGADDRDKG